MKKYQETGDVFPGIKKYQKLGVTILCKLYVLIVWTVCMLRDVTSLTKYITL